MPTYVYDDVTSVYDDVTSAYDDVTYVCRICRIRMPGTAHVPK